MTHWKVKFDSQNLTSYLEAYVHNFTELSSLQLVAVIC
jgi:hypothetical protein